MFLIAQPLEHLPRLRGILWLTQDGTVDGHDRIRGQNPAVTMFFRHLHGFSTGQAFHVILGDSPSRVPSSASLGMISKAMPQRLRVLAAGAKPRLK